MPGAAELGQGRPQDCQGWVARPGAPSSVSLAPGLSPGVFNQGWFSQPCPGPRLAVPGVTEHLRPDIWGRGWDPSTPAQELGGLRVEGPPNVEDKVPGSLIFGIWDTWVCKIRVAR